VSEDVDAAGPERPLAIYRRTPNGILVIFKDQSRVHMQAGDTLVVTYVVDAGGNLSAAGPQDFEPRPL
jgi:hypothetical protein